MITQLGLTKPGIHQLFTKAVPVLAQSNSKLDMPNSYWHLIHHKNPMHSVHNSHTVLPVTMRISIHGKIHEYFLINCGTFTKKKQSTSQNSAISKCKAAKSLHNFHPPCQPVLLLLESLQTESVRHSSDSATLSLRIFLKFPKYL